MMRNDDEKKLTGRARRHADDRSDASQTAERPGEYRALDRALQALCGGSAPSRNEPPYVVLPVRVTRLRRLAIGAAWCTAGAGLTLALGAVVPRFVNGSEELATFAQRANVAYEVYAPERLHPVEVPAAQERGLTDWLSARLERPLSAPSLEEHGYSLIGGRLLPGEAGPAAQFMYENQNHERLSFYQAGIGSNEPELQLFLDGSSRTFYWVSKGTGYALSGPVTEGMLRNIAIEVCREFGGNPEAWQ
jgi:anti-sigma factor RsiW